MMRGLILGLALLLLGPPALAAEPDQIYHAGLQAYGRGDYLAASEHLFAYRQVAGAGLDPGFLQQVNEALGYAEAQVRVAIETKRQLDEKGNVTQVVIEASGKADDPGGRREETKAFRPPPDVRGPKPRLPGQPATKPGGTFVVGEVVKPLPAPGRLALDRAARPDGGGKGTSIEDDLERIQRKYELLREELRRCQKERGR